MKKKIDLADLSVIPWIIKNNLKVETGEAYDFRRHMFWFDVLRDNSPQQVWLKAAQVGGTTVALIKALFLCDRQKMDVLYTMPTMDDISFIGGKLNRMMSMNPSLKELVKDKDAIEQKLVGDRMLYFRGSFTERQAIALPADVLIHDEEDRSNQNVLGVFASRLQHSKHAWQWHFSNPSYEGHGVSKYWARSDQKHWFIKCKGCQKEQYLSWPDSIDIEGKRYTCKHCDRTLTDEERRKGRWVKKFNDRDFSGYWISALMAPWISAAYIVDQYENKGREYFWNFVLGLPYVGEGNIVTPDVIFRNCTPKVNSQEDVVIGVDIGKTIHYVLGNAEGLFYAGTTNDPDDIERLLAQYKRSIAVIDAGPDIFWPRKMREKHIGRVYLCTFSRDRKTETVFRWGQNAEEGRVLADRNRAIQLVIDEFADGRIALQGTQDDWQEYYSHWKTMYRRNDTDSIGNPTYVWDSSDGNDHFALATTYYRAGMDRFGTSGGVKFFGGDTRKFPATVGPVIGFDNKTMNPQVLASFKKRAGDSIDELWR